MHPDQATEPIVDAGLLYCRPVAVVPCCVFPELAPQRRLPCAHRRPDCALCPNGKTVTNTEDFVQYLSLKIRSRAVAHSGPQGCDLRAVEIAAPKEKPVCRHWHRKGACRHGESCQFAHPPPGALPVWSCRATPELELKFSVVDNVHSRTVHRLDFVGANAVVFSIGGCALPRSPDTLEAEAEAEAEPQSVPQLGQQLLATSMVHPRHTGIAWCHDRDQHVQSTGC